MNSLRLLLITGRTTRQGAGISAGKMGEQYREATSVVELSPEDMNRLGIHDGTWVRLHTDHGFAEVKCRKASMQTGLAFVAFGPTCNRLVGGETFASGMPDTKHVPVLITPLPPVQGDESDEKGSKTVIEQGRQCK